PGGTSWPGAGRRPRSPPARRRDRPAGPCTRSALPPCGQSSANRALRTGPAITSNVQEAVGALTNLRATVTGSQATRLTYPGACGTLVPSLSECCMGEVGDGSCDRHLDCDRRRSGSWAQG